jgi:hypothetical protein
MQSKQAIMDEIGKTLARSARITEAAKVRAATNIKLALSGSGFGDAQLRALAKTITPANTGATRGGILDGIQSITIPAEQDLTSPPDPPKDLDSYFTNPEPEDAVSHFELPEDGEAFSHAVADQYPLMGFDIKRPVPSASLEARFMQGQGPKYLPTSGSPIVASPDKARTTTLQKSAAGTRVAKLQRLEALVTLLAKYANGDDAAGVVLGIR